jgi:hypothetical protein
MAKKSVSRSKSEPTAAPAGAAPAARPRARAKKTASDTPAASIAVAGDTADPTHMLPAASDNASVSMASEPSEDDIRLRAYQRYLERGGGHGMDFDDWVQARQELIAKK